MNYEIKVEKIETNYLVRGEEYKPAVQSFVIYVRDMYGKVVGGLTGGTYKAFARIQMIWFEHDSLWRALSGEVLQLVEELAIERGCDHCFAEDCTKIGVDTLEESGYVRLHGLPGYSGVGEPFGLIRNFDMSMAKTLEVNITNTSDTQPPYV